MEFFHNSYNNVLNTLIKLTIYSFNNIANNHTAFKTERAKEELSLKNLRKCFRFYLKIYHFI